MLLTVDVDSPDPTAAPAPLGQAVSSIAASTDQPRLFATSPCTGKVSRIDSLKFTDVATLPRAAALAVTNERVWAAGSKPSTPSCYNPSNGSTVTCNSSSVASCTASSGFPIAFASTGANLIVLSIPIDGSTAPTEVDVPEPRETIVATDDPARQHAQVLRALGMQPVDLVTLPGGQYVSLVTKNTFFITSLVSGSTEILPCLSTTTGDWLLIDMASSSVANRVRTQCDLMPVIAPPGTIFPMWACDDPPVGQANAFGDPPGYQSISVGALFGAR